MYISTQEELTAFISLVQDSDVLAIDTEFHREKTYRATLCLVQMATNDVSALIDPLSDTLDLTLLAPLLQNPAITKVFHAGTQDIELLLEYVGCTPTPVFDTQIAAGILGYPQQMGYGALVRAFAGVSLEKSDSYTDWSRRPLLASQVEYAIDDVLYLPGIYHAMLEQLQKLGRLHWLDSEFAHLGDPATYAVDYSKCWQKVKKCNSLARKQLAVVQAVAVWREKTAQRRNVPRKWVLADDLVVEIAKRTPTTKQELFKVRGLQERLASRSVDEIMDAIGEILAQDPETWPHHEQKAPVQTCDEGLLDLMGVMLKHCAREHGVTPQLLGTRDDLIRLASGEMDVCLMQDWRKEIVGNQLIALMQGKSCLMIKDGKLDAMGFDGGVAVTQGSEL